MILNTVLGMRLPINSFSCENSLMAIKFPEISRHSSQVVTGSGGSNLQHLGARPHGERSSASLQRWSRGSAPAGSRGRALVRGSRGQSPPKLKHFLVFRRSMEATNLPIFLQFGNAKKSDICAMFPKTHGWPRNWGAWSKTGGVVVPPGPGLKPPLVTGHPVND